MTINELILQLETLRDEHGNVPVYIADNECGDSDSCRAVFRDKPWEMFTGEKPAGVVIE